ncbi:MAG TPA: SDR family oxidoreductase [Candidatus Sulfotelmatobacter sp.]|nr:SDR family oxidoreductase [Candidatus Sulfotelmatobacter sp.]
MKVLVTGASGYVGRRLAERLFASGHEVTCMVRRQTGPLSFDKYARMVEADALRPETLAPALTDIEVAYYLIHSMSGREAGFDQRDREAAYNFAIAAKKAGVRRVIYLGGLAAAGANISLHLKSRHDTGAVLRKYGPPLVEFRAGIIVGNGSISFEIIRCLTERLPLMICPRWVMTRTQPIAIDDVLAYLIAALDIGGYVEKPVEIGGATVETYRSMMLGYARQRGLKRWLLRVPVLTPRLSSYWLDLVTPFPPAMSRPLIEGLKSESVCTGNLASQLFPEIRPVSYDLAVRKALSRPAPSLTLPALAAPVHRTIRAEGIICDLREVVVDASPDRVFAVVENLGGEHGWLSFDVLWKIRGWMDRLIGGPGNSRGRSRRSGMRVGDVIDFWRVQQMEAPRTVLLRAEMKVPGAAWLQFELRPERPGRTLLRCCAWFQPRGLFGEIYWYALYPIHLLIFSKLVRAVSRQAELPSTVPTGEAVA